MPPNVIHLAFPSSTLTNNGGGVVVPNNVVRNDVGGGEEEHGTDDSTTTILRAENWSRTWSCPASAKSGRTVNPIRRIVDSIQKNDTSSSPSSSSQPNHQTNKTRISLALGDPSCYDNLEPCPILLRAAVRCATSRHHAGYANACGSPESRAAVARYYSTPESPLTPDDVILASGCSGALELALTSLLDEGSTILVPRPGFPLYQVIAESHGANVIHYDLLPDKRWECDISHMDQLAMEHRKTLRAIVITNPSNPCGSVFSKQHLRDIVKFAERHRLPIVSDEVYGDMTFGDGASFHPLAHVTGSMGRNVPIITASGLGKQFLVPGWRLGWLTFLDSKEGAIQQVKRGVERLSQVILGPSHLIQGTIPSVLDPQTTEDRLAITQWKSNLNSTLENQCRFTYDYLLNKCHGLLTPIPSNGAMYVMVRLNPDKFDDTIENDMDFTRLLLHEENVFTLPGTAFGAPNFFRVVYCASTDVLGDAYERIALFCARHHAAAGSTSSSRKP